MIRLIISVVILVKYVREEICSVFENYNGTLVII